MNKETKEILRERIIRFRRVLKDAEESTTQGYEAPSFPDKQVSLTLISPDKQTCSCLDIQNHWLLHSTLDSTTQYIALKYNLVVVGTSNGQDMFLFSIVMAEESGGVYRIPTEALVTYVNTDLCRSRAIQNMTGSIEHWERKLEKLEKLQ